MSEANTAVCFRSRRNRFACDVGYYKFFRPASLMSVRNGINQRSRALEWSAVISLAFCGACGEVSGEAGGTKPAE